MNVPRRSLRVLGGRLRLYRGDWLAGLVVLAMLVAGCGREELSTRYGRHRFTGEAASVNGTDVLAGMFTAAGHDVHFRRTLVTSEMENADVVVWIPDSSAAPTDEVCEWFDTWLTEYPGRTLVYVGRDFGAGPIYFDFLSKHRLKQLGKTPPETKQPAEPTAKQAEATKDKSTPQAAAKSEPTASEAKPDAGVKDKGSAEDTTQGDPTDKAPGKKDGKKDGKDTDDRRDSEWFIYQPGDYRKARTLSGPWAGGIDAAKSEIELRTRLVPHEDIEELLTTDGDVIVSSESKPEWDGSQIIYVANGSFLLNLPLVNHEHRKLAGKLVESTGEPGHVVFLESGAGGPPIDPPHTDNSVWTLFNAWPLGAILLQLAAVGVVYCFAKWPIFGHPQQPPPDSVADFSKHVSAVGRLLARTKDRQFALDRVAPGEAGHARSAISAAPSLVVVSGQADAATESIARRPPALPPAPKGN